MDQSVTVATGEYRGELVDVVTGHNPSIRTGARGLVLGQRDVHQSHANRAPALAKDPYRRVDVIVSRELPCDSGNPLIHVTMELTAPEFRLLWCHVPYSVRIGRRCSTADLDLAQEPVPYNRLADGRWRQHSTTLCFDRAHGRRDGPRSASRDTKSPA